MSTTQDKSNKIRSIDTAQIETKNWWESQGFFMSLVMVGGSAYGLTEDVAQSMVAAVFGAISSVAFVFQFFKTSKFVGWKSVVTDGNTLQYLGGAIGAFIPNAPLLIPALDDLADAIWSKNFGLIVTATVAFAVSAYNIFIKKK